MQTYDLTIVIDGKATSAKRKSVIKSLEKIITTMKGKVSEVEEWGKKDLAYKIKASETGFFINFVLELDEAAAGAVSGKLKFEEDIIRYLLVKRV